MWNVYRPDAALRDLETAALMVIAAGTLAPIPLTGVWRSPSRLRPLARNAAVFVQAAYGWMAAAAVLLIYGAIDALAQGRPLAFHHADAVRHMLAVGVVTMMIVGMAYLITPAFAVPRQHGARQVWDVRAIWTALMAATVLRLAGALIQDVDLLDARHWLMAAAGALALAAVAGFAGALLRGARTRPLPPPPGVQDRAASD